MVGSNPTGLTESRNEPPLELGSPFLKIDEKTGRMVPEVTQGNGLWVINGKKPHPSTGFLYATYNYQLPVMFPQQYMPHCGRNFSSAKTR